MAMIADSTMHRTLNGQTVAWTPTTNGLPTTLAPSTPVREPGTPAPPLPEAPVSMNIFVDVPGYANRAQVTARALTATEAAQTLKASVDALHAAFAPPPLPSRGERLALLLSCGTQKALAHGDTARIDRLAKAYVLVVRGLIEQVTRDGVPQGWYEVQSQTAAGTHYSVENQSCTCQDARQHADDKTWWCKHSLGCLMVAKLDAQEAAF